MQYEVVVRKPDQYTSAGQKYAVVVRTNDTMVALGSLLERRGLGQKASVIDTQDGQFVGVDQLRDRLELEGGRLQEQIARGAD